MIILLMLMLLCGPVDAAQKVGTFGAPNASGSAPLEVDSDRKITIETDASLYIDGEFVIDDALYLGGSEVDGAWLIKVVGDNLEFQRRESGIWTMKGKVQP